MGYNRVVGKYFVGKVLDSEDAKVNYIHGDDVVSTSIFVLIILMVFLIYVVFFIQLEMKYI